jgi:hypothetical protein
VFAVRGDAGGLVVDGDAVGEVFVPGVGEGDWLPVRVVESELEGGGDVSDGEQPAGVKVVAGALRISCKAVRNGEDYEDAVAHDLGIFLSVFSILCLR